MRTHHARKRKCYGQAATSRRSCDSSETVEIKGVYQENDRHDFIKDIIYKGEKGKNKNCNSARDKFKLNILYLVLREIIHSF